MKTATGVAILKTVKETNKNTSSGQSSQSHYCHQHWQFAVIFTPLHDKFRLLPIKSHSMSKRMPEINFPSNFKKCAPGDWLVCPCHANPAVLTPSCNTVHNMESYFVFKCFSEIYINDV